MDTHVLHRDIKPENVLRDAKGRVKIVDFGIAKLVGDRASSDDTLTLQGSILGSPHYMAPEQIEKPGDVDQRADIYSLGVVFYEMLTGELAIGRFALPSQKASMDDRIDAIVLCTLEKEREARYQSAEEVQTSVGALAQEPPTPPQETVPENGGGRSRAKFSLASALLTGTSLILGAGLLLMVFSLEPTRIAGSAEGSSVGGGGSSFNLSRMVLAALSILVPPVCALLGFVFGVKALAEIRESGGRKDGLGHASFGTLAWPVVFLFLMAIIIVALAEGFDGSNGEFWWLPIPVVVVTALVAAFLLVRGVVRWGPVGSMTDTAGEATRDFGGPWSFPCSWQSSCPRSLRS